MRSLEEIKAEMEKTKRELSKAEEKAINCHNHLQELEDELKSVEKYKRQRYIRHLSRMNDEVEPEIIKALFIEPGGKWKDVEIKNNLESFQTAVKGPIETISTGSSYVLIVNAARDVCLMSGTVNAFVANIENINNREAPYFERFYICGPVVAVSANEDKLCSITEQDRDFIIREFHPY